MFEKCKEFKEKFSTAIKVSHYSLIALGAYKVYEVVKVVVGAF